MSMKDKEEATFASVSQHTYMTHFNTFLSLRLFAAAYQHASRDEYVAAVSALMDAYQGSMRMMLDAEAAAQKKLGLFPSARHRALRAEAFSAVTQSMHDYLLALRPEEKTEGQTENTNA